MNLHFKTITPPAEEPFTVDELKLFARIDNSDEDTLLAGFIEATRIAAEEYLRRALITQTIRMTFDYWPDDLELPWTNLISISKVETLDEEDNATIFPATSYFVNTIEEPARLVIKREVTRPINTDREKSGYAVEYIAGYGAAVDVPQSLIEGIKLWATSVFENRAIITKPPPEAMPLLSQFRILEI